MSMADSNDQSRLMESLRAYESIGSLNLPFLDEQSSAGRDFDIQLNEMLQVNGTPQNDGMLDAGPLEQLPQLPYHPSEIQQNNGMLDAPPLEQLSQFSKFSSHPNQKPKQNIDLDWPMDNVSEASSTMSRTTAIVVYDGKGHKRGGSFTKNLKNVNNGEPGGSSRTQFREADMERARLILPLLSGTIAILRYGCGCRSPRGTCNHNTFIAGLALPDGIVCANCQAGATEKEITTPRFCPPHRRHHTRQSRTHLRHLGHTPESINLNYPTSPDLIQDFPATPNQQQICERHLQAALRGETSGLEGVISGWSRVQREWYERKRRHLRLWPRIFERGKF